MGTEGQISPCTANMGDDQRKNYAFWVVLGSPEDEYMREDFWGEEVDRMYWVGCADGAKYVDLWNFGDDWGWLQLETKH